MAYGILTDGGVMVAVWASLAALILADLYVILRNVRVVVVRVKRRARGG